MKKTEDLVTELRAWGTNGYMMQAADEIERLRAERDEARRMYCEEAFCHRFNERGGEGTITDPRQIAHSMGWDCFKERQ